MSKPKERIPFQIINPGGNMTALVNYAMPSKMKGKVNDLIMKEYPKVEQVGFLPFRLSMAGGEFCANATRSAVYTLLGGQPGQIPIKVSGTNKVLMAGIDKRGVWTEVPIYKNLRKIQKKGSAYLVQMQGITHVVIEEKTAGLPEVKIKQKALTLLKKLDLLTSVAVGVIFLQKFPSYYSIRPVVWVRNIKTLICETGCGSGSVAIGLVESTMQKKSMTLKIKQPSGSFYDVRVYFEENKFERAVLSGPVKIKVKGELKL